MKTGIKRMLHADARLPRSFLLVLRWFYHGGVYAREAFQALYAAVIVKPVMQAIATGGRHLRIERIPYIRGRGRIDLGDDVYISGLLGVSFLHREGVLTTENTEHTENGESTTNNQEPTTKNDEPRTKNKVPLLKIGSRSFIGHQCSFAMSKGIVIGDDCMIGAGTRIQDNDGHPLDPDARRKHEKVAIGNIKPVVIGNNVWIAPRCTILKGVTIGDNAVVGTGSVVTRDVAAGTVVAGVPAKVLRRVSA